MISTLKNMTTLYSLSIYSHKVNYGAIVKKLRLIFVWHMHQPYYKDDMTGQYTMPWVFLHAIKDYYELPWLVEKFSKVKAVFNLVPSLLIQLQEYENENVNDKFLIELKKPVATLTAQEKLYLVQNLFHSNLTTMIAPLPKYLELANKKSTFTDMEDFSKRLSEQELLDLEVLFLLSWCGNAIKKKSEIVGALIQKQFGFAELDKAVLLAELFAFIKEIIPYYKQLQENGIIEVFTTPFYHPILPILINQNSAVDALPSVELPKKMCSFSDDAPLHVDSAVKLYTKLFDLPPSGFWPAEGGISYDALNMLSKNGVRYCAADEDILFKTLNDTNRHNIYKKYHLKFEDREFGIFFRDKQLSDLIGFTYSGWDGKDAAVDFIGRLRSIYNDCGFDPIIPIVLDGENAWEFYENNAFEFFTSLYESIEKADWIECVRAVELFSDNNCINVELPHIRSGSWIYGTFSTWIGQNEKNKAWEILSITKEFVNENIKKLPQNKANAVQKELMIAEGSDWFWWYGDDHYTPLADQFDMLFRKHLINIYDIFNEKPPVAILTPIVSKAKSPYIQKPKGYISPKIDGETSSFFEWMGAGIVELGFEFTAMDSSGFILKKLLYGFDENYLYFSLQGDFSNIKDKDYELGMQIVSNSRIHMKTPILSNLSGFTRHLANSEDVAFEARVGNSFELRIAKTVLDAYGLTNVEVVFELYKNGRQIERAPLYSLLGIEINGDFSDEWYI